VTQAAREHDKINREALLRCKDAIPKPVTSLTGFQHLAKQQQPVFNTPLNSSSSRLRFLQASVSSRAFFRSPRSEVTSAVCSAFITAYLCGYNVRNSYMSAAH
jgi:hypothetical protein